PWFLGSMLVAYLLCNLYLRYTTPVYRIAGEIIINDTKGGNSEILLEGILNPGKSDLNNVMRILKSKTSMTRVVEELKLNIRYFEPGKVKIFEYYNNSTFEIIFLDSADQAYSPAYR